MNLRLDGGKSHSKKGFKEFFQRTLSLLPSNYKIVFVRLDKGYFGENTFQYLEEEGIRYVAASKNTGPLRKKAASLSDKEWEEIEKNSLYFTEIEYSYKTWKSEKRMIIKKSLSPNPNYDEKEKDIFGNPVEPPFTVEYRFYVTNICRVGEWVTPPTPHRTDHADLQQPTLLRRCPFAGSKSCINYLS